jgi:FkbM family methyltransferase
MLTPHHNVYYSQNREDLILAGILRDVPVGFYVDVGANHPVFDSVTKIFYDKGWSGINIEPDARLNAELCEQRPRDINIKIGLSSQPGTLLFRSYESSSGLSTFSSELKQMYEQLGPHSTYKETSIAVTSLAQVLNQHRPSGDIHFLKIDVEGLELEVLLGNSWDRYRPWVMCIERNLNCARREAITAFLGSWGYSHVFFDGINDYSIANERRPIWDRFSYAQEMIMEGIPAHYSLTRDDVAFPANGNATSSAQALLALDGEEFLRAAYATVLNRSIDADGLRTYMTELNNGIDKMTIVSRLRNSAEGRRQMIPLAGYRRALIRSRLQRSLRRATSNI